MHTYLHIHAYTIQTIQQWQDDSARKSDYEPLGLKTDKSNNRFISLHFCCCVVCRHRTRCIYMGVRGSLYIDLYLLRTCVFDFGIFVQGARASIFCVLKLRMKWIAFDSCYFCIFACFALFFCVVPLLFRRVVFPRSFFLHTHSFWGGGGGVAPKLTQFRLTHILSSSVGITFGFHMHGESAEIFTYHLCVQFLYFFC